MAKLEAVIFDLDDTLYPEIEYVKSGFKAVAVWAKDTLSIAEDIAFYEFLNIFIEGERSKVFNIWLEKHGFNTSTWLQQMIEVYRNHRPCIKPYEEVPEVLSQLKQSYRLGLVTDGYLHVQKRKLEALGLLPFFDVVVFSDELGRAAWKPCTTPFEVALHRLKIKRGVYVADNPLKDFAGARAAGLWTIRVRRPDNIHWHTEAPSEDFAPDVEIANLKELIPTLKMIECISSRRHKYKK